MMVKIIILSNFVGSIYERETVPDEDFFNRASATRVKGVSWPNNKNMMADPKRFLDEGPNINIRLPRKSYSTIEEKKYFYNKIKIKQKTEVSNW